MAYKVTTTKKTLAASDVAVDTYGVVFPTASTVAADEKYHHADTAFKFFFTCLAILHVTSHFLNHTSP